jgi:hypothetical protein
MDVAASIGKLLPRMIPLGVLTLAVVVAWNRYYTVLSEGVCEVSSALGGGQCSPGTVSDPRALLDAATHADASGQGRRQICAALGSLPFAVEGCDDTPSQPPCRDRARTAACDPTKWLGLGTSPGLGDCEVEAVNDTLPYEFNVEPAARSRGPGCNVTKIRVDASARVTFCFQSLRLKVDRGFPDKQLLGQQYVGANAGEYCPPGSLEASYDAAGGTPSTSKLDIARYALKGSPAPEVVVIPATVSGAKRTDSDDRADFAFARRALAVERLRRDGNRAPTVPEVARKAREVSRDYEQKGFTWHHADLLRGADGRYYYQMILVPSAIHDTTPHDGGSTWARSRGIAQDASALQPPWDALQPSPRLSPVLPRGWPQAVPQELPEACRPCTDG